MDKTSKVCFVYSSLTSFVEKDLKSLNLIAKKVFTIKSPPFKNLFLFLINRLNEIFKSIIFISRSDNLVIWFSDYHATIPLFISKIFFVKSILIIGGYDAISDKKLNHGVFSKTNFRQVLSKFNMWLTTNIWVVDKTLAEGCKQALRQNKINSGILNWMPKLKKKISIVPTGYSSLFWRKVKTKESNTVLTVANFSDQRVIKIKGIPFVLRLAKELPEFNFIILGVNSEELIPENLRYPNVRIIKQKNKVQLRKYFSTSQFYIQASRLEGLPNALCEAMLCECIPIGNSVFGIPSAIGNTGMLFEGPSELQKVISFLKNNDKIGNQARKRIISLFSEEKRIKKFKQI